MQRTTPAGRRYLKRFAPTMLAYVVAVLGTSMAVDQLHPTGAALVMLSILPAVPILAMLLVIGLYVREEADEYLRQRIVTAMLIGIGVVLAAATVLGFLQIYRAIEQVYVILGFPIWCGTWGLSQGVMAWRDRMRGEA